MNTNPSPAIDEASGRSYLDWLASVSPGGHEKEETDWKIIEAERLDDQRLEDLSIEVYGY